MWMHVCLCVCVCVSSASAEIAFQQQAHQQASYSEFYCETSAYHRALFDLALGSFGHVSKKNNQFEDSFDSKRRQCDVHVLKSQLRGDFT